MKIKKYTISKVFDKHDSWKWSITITFAPSWFDYFSFDKSVATTTLTGRCSTWKWSNGSLANYIWQIWAFDVTNG